MSNATMTNSPVAVLHWPAEAEQRVSLADRRVPRLLLVQPGDVPPSDLADDEDWARTTADPLEVHSRIARLLSRSSIDESIPRLDDNGLLWRGDNWVALGPTEACITQILIASFGKLVVREKLTSCWPDPSSSALGVQLLRLRRRIEPLGLEIHTVRGQGYVLR